MRHLAALLCACALYAADGVPELKEIPYDTVIFSDGRTMPGTLLERRTDDTLVFQPIGKEKPISIPKGSWHEIQPRRPASRIATEVGRHAIATGNIRLLGEAIRFAAEKGAGEVAATLVRDGLAATPGNRDLLAVALPFLIERKDWASVEAVARAGLRTDPHWEDGHGHILDALAAQQRGDEVLAYARAWLAANPTAVRANLLCAPALEASGDLRQARECWRKSWELGKSMDGALGFARTSVQLGAYADGARAAKALLEANTHTAEATAWAAAAAAALGDDATAGPLLAGAKPEELPGPAAHAALYAKGLLAYRTGNAAAAAKLWAEIPTPAAQLAHSIASRREFRSSDRLGDELKPAARLLNAAVRLEQSRPAEARQLLDPHLDGRHAFLVRVADMLIAKGSAASVRALVAVRSAESMRWQLFGHILAGRLADAETTAKQLGQDGYAAACRVFLAAARGDPEAAGQLVQNLPSDASSPTAYVQRLNELYASATDQAVTETFDWPAGEVTQTGWDVQAPGTGIRITAGGGRLTMAGTQKTTDLTSVATPVPGARLRAARLVCDIGAAAQATVGLALTDGSRKNGIAIAVQAGSQRLAWRQLTQGAYGPWKELPWTITGTQAVIAIDANGGRIFAADPADPTRRLQLADALVRAQGDWLLTVFGTATPGTAWSAAFDELRWRLRTDAR